MRYLVVGSGVAAAASARALLATGAEVTVTDRRAGPATEALAAAGARVVVGDPAPLSLLDEADDVIVSPGVPPHDRLAAAAVAAGHDVYCEPELAWRLRDAGAPPWLAITGTNGKTTTTTMLAAILSAAGHVTAAVGNVGEPLAGPITRSDGGAEVLAVELSSFQLYWSATMAPQVGAILNFADDHLEWHGNFDAYTTAKLAIWRSAAPGGTGIAIGNLDDPLVAAALAGVPGATVGLTLAEPKPGQLGVVDGMLVDFVDWRRFPGRAGWARDGGRVEWVCRGVIPEGEEDGVPVPLFEAGSVRPAGAHNVSNALAAAAAARAYGVPAAAVRQGLAGYAPEPHRNAPVATVDGVVYVNDSKATNPHAAAASLRAYPSIVWVAGGQLKGVDVDGLVAEIASRLRGVVLLGVDRAEIAAALARHAPDVPVIDIASTDDGAMAEVVRAAARLARAGDTVLLAPAAASKDMYKGYDARGDAFAAAVRALEPAAGR